VLATASARDTGFVRGLGADDVIDYHATPFYERIRDIDVVLDTIGGETREHSWRVLRKGGVLVTLVSPIPTGVAEQHGVRAIFFIVRGNRAQLDQISALVDDGKLRPVVAEVLPLARWDRTPRFRGGRLLLRSDCSNTHLRLRGTHEWRSFSF
jgi:NADPH:quinone reductase-like Zn-dependent oxidoreductase